MQQHGDAADAGGQQEDQLPDGIDPQTADAIQRSIDKLGAEELAACQKLIVARLIRLASEGGLEEAAADLAQLDAILQGVPEDSKPARLVLDSLADESAALGRVFGRPGLMAAAGTEAARISLAVLRHKQHSHDMPELLAHLQPAATACFSMLADGPDGTAGGLDPVAALPAAKLAAAAAAGEGLPAEARPLLLRLLHRYRVATEADVAGWLAAAAAAEEAALSAEAAAAAAEHAAAAEAEGRAGDSTTGSDGAGSDGNSCADTEVVEGAFSNGWQSPWAQLLALTLTALASSLATDGSATRSGNSGGGVGGGVSAGDVDGTAAAASGSGSSSVESGGSNIETPDSSDPAGLTPGSTEAALLAGALTLVRHQVTPASKLVLADKDISAGILTPLTVGTPGSALQQQLLASLGQAVADQAAQLTAASCSHAAFGAQSAALARLAGQAADAAHVCWRHRGAWCSDAAAAAAWRDWGNRLAVGLQLLAGRLGKDAAGDAGAEFALLRAASKLDSACEVTLMALVVALTPDGLQQPVIPQLVNALAGLCRCHHDIIRRQAAAVSHAPMLSDSVIRPFRSAVTSIELAASGIMAAAASAPGADPPTPLLRSLCRGASDFMVVADLEDLHFECSGGAEVAADGGRDSLCTVQRGAELVAKLLRAFGDAAIEQLVSVKGVTALLVGLWIACREAPLPPPAIATLRAVCRALALCFGASAAARKQAGASLPGSGDECSWSDRAACARQVVAKEPPRRRQMVERALRDVEEALQRRLPAAGSSGGSGGSPARTQASADAAMRALLAQAQPSASGATPEQPSKAALKRARKKAAAAAAAQAAGGAVAQPAAAVPQPSAHVSVCGPVCSGGGAAAAMLIASHSEAGLPRPDGRDPAQMTVPIVCFVAAAAQPAAPRLGAAGSGPGASCQVSEAADSLRGLVLHDSDAAADGGGLAASDAQSWMYCPLTKVVMTDPLVLLGDGQSYEGASIRAWLRTHAVSPVTGQLLPSRDLVQNHALRNMIQAIR